MCSRDKSFSVEDHVNPFRIASYVQLTSHFSISNGPLIIELADSTVLHCDVPVDQFNEGTRIERKRGKKKDRVARMLIFINRWQIDNTHAILHLDRFRGAEQTFLYLRVVRLLINPSCLDRPDTNFIKNVEAQRVREREKRRKRISDHWDHRFARKRLLVFISIGIPRKREGKKVI